MQHWHIWRLTQSARTSNGSSTWVNCTSTHHVFFLSVPCRYPARDPSVSDDDDEPSDSTPDDDQQHHQLGKEVADGIEALEAYFGEDPDAMNELLGQFLAERRARLAAASRAQGMQTLPLPRLRGRRHHYTVVVKMEKRRPKPKPQRLQN